MDVKKHLESVRVSSENIGFDTKNVLKKICKTIYNIGYLIIGGIIMAAFGFFMGMNIKQK